MGKKRRKDLSTDQLDIFDNGPNDLPIPRPISSGPIRTLDIVFDPAKDELDLIEQPKPVENLANNNKPGCRLCHDISRLTSIYSGRAGGPVHKDCYEFWRQHAYAPDMINP
ncbi:MAG: hypothetical protein KAV87_13670 [Desulfobacteraceae bacterium]|nr:hypothetical protein [Desulfobacteraceae bacterium]